jgi:hypothetical protein
MKFQKIISGGKTVADKGGLEAVIELGIPLGGWCSKGRIAEDGKIPEKYKLEEMSNKVIFPPFFQEGGFW